ncbi:MAG: MFS transporter [Gammaproteobacteria bacterium]|nr:MFS transporter [Gammaproteobacteria bacterium]
MTFALWRALAALGGYCLISQSLAWLLIFQYTIHAYDSAWQIGLIAASGASGLAFAQLVNDRILFRYGPYRLYWVCCAVIGLLLWQLSALKIHFLSDLIARFIIGWSDGMVFLIIESWILFLAPAEQRASVLAWYLAVLYGSQFCCPVLAQYHLDGTPLIVPISFFVLLVASIPIQGLKPFLEHQEAPSGWPVFAEWNLVMLGGVGAALCALSGVLLPSWTAFFPSILLYHGLPKKTVQFFLLGGIVGQYVIIGTEKYWNVSKQIHIMTSLGILALLLTVFSFEGHMIETPYLKYFSIFLLGVVSYCLYGLGMAKAIANVAPEYLVRANKTFLSCYTLPAILSPAFFGLFATQQMQFSMLATTTFLGFLTVRYFNLRKF